MYTFRTIPLVGACDVIAVDQKEKLNAWLLSVHNPELARFDFV
jgi:hypothetical protein